MGETNGGADIGTDGRIIRERMCAEPDDGIVVFLIRMRIQMVVQY